MANPDVFLSQMSNPPFFRTFCGSILHVDKYQLDGVIIFQRRGYNGLYVATNNYVSSLRLLEDDGTIKVYQTDSLDYVFVYTYSSYLNSEQALHVFRIVLAKVSHYGVKRLGMNALRLDEFSRSRILNGEVMIHLVQDSLSLLKGGSVESVCFIDSIGSFPMMGDEK